MSELGQLRQVASVFGDSLELFESLYEVFLSKPDFGCAGVLVTPLSSDIRVKQGIPVGNYSWSCEVSVQAK